ncbi:MAG: hypothetical protein CI952_1579, partial [Methanohalophilus sp.]
ISSSNILQAIIVRVDRLNHLYKIEKGKDLKIAPFGLIF